MLIGFFEAICYNILILSKALGKGGAIVTLKRRNGFAKIKKHMPTHCKKQYIGNERK